MDKNTDIITKIKTLLGIENSKIELSQMKLEDGLTIVESENFEAGEEINIITEEGKVAMPKGDYKLEDGRLLVVKEEGIIDHVKSEDEKEEKEVKEEVIEKEEKEEYVEQESETPKKIVESVTKEFHFEEIEKLKKEIEDLKLKSIEKEVEKTDVEVEEVKLEEVEKVEPIVHNPEKKKVTEGYKFSQNRTETTLDRVLRKLSE